MPLFSMFTNVIVSQSKYFATLKMTPVILCVVLQKVQEKLLCVSPCCHLYFNEENNGLGLWL